MHTRSLQLSQIWNMHTLRVWKHKGSKTLNCDASSFLYFSHTVQWEERQKAESKKNVDGGG